jgi:hypothetical protein
MTDKEIRKTADEDRQEDLELSDQDAENVAGGQPANGSLGPAVTFKYDLKAQKEG